MDKLILDMKKWNKIVYFLEMFVLILTITGFSLGIYSIEEEIFSVDGVMDQNVKIINILAVLSIVIIIFFICCKKRRKKKLLLSKGKIMEAKFSKNEFEFGIRRYDHSYYVVGYLVEDNCTYRFNCKVLDFHSEGLEIFNEIKKRGRFPKISVLVEEANYNNYEMKIFDFLNETLEMNKDIVDEIRYRL